MWESNDRSEIFKKEKEFILLYGRKDMKTGSLVNMTDGGDGLVGFNASIYYKKIHKYTLLGEYITSFVSITECAKLTGISTSELVRGCKTNCFVKGYQYSYDKKEKIAPILSRYDKAAKSLGKKIYLKDASGNILKEFANNKEAQKVLKLSRNTISAYCLKAVKQTRDIYLSY